MHMCYLFFSLFFSLSLSLYIYMLRHTFKSMYIYI